MLEGCGGCDGCDGWVATPKPPKPPVPKIELDVKDIYEPAPAQLTGHGGASSDDVLLCPRPLDRKNQFVLEVLLMLVLGLGSS